jgi:hypothetical protein
MAVYGKGYETKKRFIILTYEKLLENHASLLTVRNLAHGQGYSASSVYKHFKSLEYLLVVASIRFLDKYMYEFGKLMDSDEDLLKMYIDGWKIFNRYAFERPDIYYRLFWGQYNKEFTIAIQEYFELFPFSGSEKYPAYFYSIMFDDSIQERDFLMLHRASSSKLLSEENARLLSRINPLIVKGMLAEVMEQTPDVRKQAEQECNYLIEKTLEKARNQGLSSVPGIKLSPGNHYNEAE